MALILFDWTTKSYKDFKLLASTGISWDNSTSQHTIKQYVSRFLQVPGLTVAFWPSINSFPPFRLYGETNSLFLFLCFTGVTGSTRDWMMFAQFKHLHNSVHPILIHGHLDLRLPSQHECSDPLELLPRPHLQPVRETVFFTPVLLLSMSPLITFLQL